MLIESEELTLREAAWLFDDVESQHDGSGLIHTPEDTVEARPGD
ncbi:MAG: hypothetical protein AAF526_04915 [Pseudomonadota bacterium]